jgi:hypothetical protein
MVPTPLKRILNVGNEIELYQYPTFGDPIFSQARHSDIKGSITRNGPPMLVIAVEATYVNQNDECCASCVSRIPVAALCLEHARQIGA